MDVRREQRNRVWRVFPPARPHLFVVGAAALVVGFVRLGAAGGLIVLACAFAAVLLFFSAGRALDGARWSRRGRIDGQYHRAAAVRAADLVALSMRVPAATPPQTIVNGDLTIGPSGLHWSPRPRWRRRGVGDLNIAWPDVTSAVLEGARSKLVPSHLRLDHLGQTVTFLVADAESLPQHLPAQAREPAAG